MYITNVTENVSEIFANLEEQENVSRMKFLLYIFNLLNNNQINNKNEANPNINVEEENLIIFNFETIGFESEACNVFLQYIISVYNIMIGINELYEENGNIMGLSFEPYEQELIAKFERLSFKEKMDIFSEAIIRYDNGTYFQERITMLVFTSQANGFDIAKRIQDFKNSIK